MPQWYRPSLVQIMSCHVLGTKPLSEPILVHCQLILKNKLQRNSNSNSNISFREFQENIVWENGGHFVSASTCYPLSPSGSFYSLPRVALWDIPVKHIPISNLGKTPSFVTAIFILPHSVQNFKNDLTTFVYVMDNESARDLSWILKVPASLLLTWFNFYPSLDR